MPIKKKKMRYDDWKLMSPDDEGSGMVSSCCGSEYQEEYESDLKFEYYVCSCCKDECEIIEEYEYKEQQRESYEEMMRDGEKDEN
jgi:hypothetical protein